MHLVVGLVNPGDRYAGTRHNVGFRVVERLCARREAALPGTTQLGSLVHSGTVNGARVLLACPQQFMNRSGKPVAALMAYYQRLPDKVVVIHDEMGLPFGEVRCRVGGGHGGHNGLRDIIQHIGRDFLRVRFGIGRPESGADVSAYVLGAWLPSEQTVLGEAIERASDAVELILTQGMTTAQNRFNVRPRTTKPSSSQSQSRPDSGAMEPS
jgi:PTH1 family peptidyl-tRNA hydrolase